MVLRKPIINGEIDTFMGWNGGRLERMPSDVREAVSGDYELPSTVHEAWAEFLAWEKLTDDRCAFFPDHSPDVRTSARTAVLENLLDTLPAVDMQTSGPGSPECSMCSISPSAAIFMRVRPASRPCAGTLSAWRSSLNGRQRRQHQSEIATVRLSNPDGAALEKDEIARELRRLAEGASKVGSL